MTGKTVTACILLITVHVFVAADASEKIDVKPGDGVKAAVEEVRGGSPELERQIKEQDDEYVRVVDEYDPRILSKSKSTSLPLDFLKLKFEVEVNKNYTTTLTFLDANGHPYPVRVSRIADGSKFTVCSGSSDDCTLDDDDIDIAHILTVNTKRMAGRGNIKGFFKGLHKAVNIPLVATKGSYHDEVTIILPVNNPDKVARDTPLSQQHTPYVLPPADDIYARGLLDNIEAGELSEATELVVDAVDMIGDAVTQEHATAIYANGKTYVKTYLKSPTPSSEALTPGAMGVAVHRFDGKPRTVSGISPTGKLVMLKITFPKNLSGWRELR